MALLDDKGLGYFVGKLKDMFAPKSHTHDDRYYTESEIDGKLSGKANSSHTHTKAQVGLGNVDNTADSAKSVNYATSAGTANEINPNNSYGSITKAVRPMFDSVRANRLAFLPSDQIIIEKTVDGGKTWTDAAITDYNKRALFSENGGGFTLPQIDGKKNALCGIRLTITGMKYNVPAGTEETAKYNYWNSKYVKDTERYCTIGDMFFWVSGSADDISLVIERATGAASTSWANLFTSSSSTGYLEGWSGPNYIKFSENTLGGGTGQTSNWWNYRFTFMSHPWNGSDFNSNYITQAQNVTMIKAYGASVWTMPNNLMSNDHMYTWDVDKNVAFPAIVSASGFNGTATKLARDGNLANPMTFNWSGKDGQPTWLWGGEDGGNMYVYNPSKFNVNSAKTAASADSAKKLATNAGSATQPVYFFNGVPVATTYTLGKSVPANAVFTDTNTWRGVQNNLTSDATDQSLSAAQGKVLKSLVDGKAAANHTHSQYLTAHQDISGKVDKSEAGANSLLATLTTTWTAAPTDDTYFVRQDTGGGSTFGRVKFSTLWSYIKGKGDATYQPKGSYAASSHTHNYAGSSSAGGSANSAAKLDTATAGSATQPVYFIGGKPAACSYTLGKSVPSNAVFTDTDTWRGIQNNLTSDSTTDSLSAAQGKVLKGLVDGKAASGHTHTKAQVGLSNVDNTADSAKSVKYATSAGSAGSATKANRVADYNDTSKSIQIGYSGNGITGDAIKYIAGYTTGDGGDVSAKIKDISKDALKGWIGSLPANGGNSTTVNGHTVNSDVPAGAKFTDTTYGLATTNSSGLMSYSDKSKLNGIASGANKTVVDSTISQSSTNPVQNGVITKRLQFLYSFKISRDKWNESSDKSNWNVIVSWTNSSGTALTGSTTGTPNLTTDMSLGPAMMERTSSLKDNTILSGELSMINQGQIYVCDTNKLSFTVKRRPVCDLMLYFYARQWTT